MDDAQQGIPTKGFLAWIERAGNKLPHPISLFIILAATVLVVSWLCSFFGVEAVHPGTGATVTVVNLLSKAGFRKIWSLAVTNFSGYAPLGVVLVAVIGTGVAEKSGFLAALMQRMLLKVSPVLVTAIIVFVCISGNVAGDSAFVVMPPLAAATYLSMGRNPLVGMFTALASVSAGFCACAILGISDALAYGFTETAARMIDPAYAASPAINYYFLLASSLLLTLTGVLVSEKVLIPRYAGIDLSRYGKIEQKELTSEERKGLKAAFWAFCVAALVVAAMCLGSDPFMGDPAKGGSIMAPTSPFMSGIIITVTVLFFIPGTVYGFVSGKYKNDKQLFADITLAFRDMAPYILLCFFSSQFASYFSWSNLGQIIAIKGASVLKSLNFTGIPLLIGIIFTACLINIFIASASAKWAILAPVFVPMLMLLNLDPAVTQVAYRIGDSITNPLTPLFSYMPLILGFAQRYEKDTGMGTVIANMFPFSFSFAIVWIIQLSVWVTLNLPLGPGGNIFLK